MKCSHSAQSGQGIATAASFVGIVSAKGVVELVTAKHPLCSIFQFASSSIFQLHGFSQFQYLSGF